LPSARSEIAQSSTSADKTKAGSRREKAPMSNWSDKLRQEIVDRVDVSKLLVSSAEAFFLENVSRRAAVKALLDKLLSHHEAKWPEEVVLDPQASEHDAVPEVARVISIKLAGVEAIWRLIHSGQFLQTSSTLSNIRMSLEWTTGSISSGWQFHEFEIPYPSSVIKAFSSASPEILSNHDLYIHELGIADMSGEIEQALREAVICFSAGLYTPCAAMLGSASEGVWEEVGYSLAQAVRPADYSKASKLEATLSNPFYSVTRKMQTVYSFYADRNLMEQVWERSQVRNLSMTLRHLPAEFCVVFRRSSPPSAG
jgi:hypothetical protein